MHTVPQSRRCSCRSDPIVVAGMLLNQFYNSQPRPSLHRAAPRRCYRFEAIGKVTSLHLAQNQQLTLAEYNARTNAFVHLPSIFNSCPTPKDRPLSGITAAVDDNICTSDMPTTCSPLVLKGTSGAYHSMNHDAMVVNVVNIVRAAGAKLVGNTNCDEFWME